MYQFYLFKYVGVDFEIGESLWVLVILDENGNIVMKFYFVVFENRFVLGDILFKVYGGFGISVIVYGFDFFVLFVYQFGGCILDYIY